MNITKAIKRAALAVMACAAGSRPSESKTEKAVMPDYLPHTGKGRNKRPHRFSGAAAAKRAAQKRKAKRR